MVVRVLELMSFCSITAIASCLTMKKDKDAQPNSKRGGDFIRLLWLLVSLIPMPFLFHYYEISKVPNRAIFLFSGTLLFTILAGLLSIKVKLNDMILANTINIIVSVALGSVFITPPNGSWFNPFGMNIAIIFTGVVILIVMLLIRFVSKAIFEVEK